MQAFVEKVTTSEISPGMTLYKVLDRLIDGYSVSDAIGAVV